MAMQNVYVNWSAGFIRVFQSLLMRCRVFCNLADTGWRQNKSGNYDINGQNKLPNIAIQVKGGRGEWGGDVCHFRQGPGISEKRENQRSSII